MHATMNEWPDGGYWTGRIGSVREDRYSVLSGQERSVDIDFEIIDNRSTNLRISNVFVPKEKPNEILYNKVIGGE
ncbi:hypothetical protein BWP39_17275 [Paraburkholderia acidicola]|uniref:Uncharacterized protein n=1 Tax=Paraburkholderia acidicola TaxID=1912599 RepID=A0A2A4F0Q6_9BURK|nr:hypothetical protein BWP39_17275 [Paraburkholderia acidicola]